MKINITVEEMSSLNLKQQMVYLLNAEKSLGEAEKDGYHYEILKIEFNELYGILINYNETLSIKWFNNIRSALKYGKEKGVKISEKM